MVGKPTALVGRRGLVLMSHGSDEDSLVAKAKAPGCKTESSLSGSLVAGIGSEPPTFRLYLQI